MYVYILKSQSLHPHYYTGITKDPKARLAKHNAKEVSHTRQYAPWEFKNLFWFSDIEKAHQFERYLKSSSGRAFTRKHF